MPFSHQSQAIGALGTLVVGGMEFHALAQDLARGRDGDGVGGGHARTRGQQILDEDQRRRLAHVISAGFEGKPPHGDLATVKVAAKMLEQTVCQVVLLPLVDRFDGGQDLQARARFLGRAEHRAQILGKAASAKPRPGVQELVADARVRAQALAHQLDVGVHRVAQTGQFVHE